ncbi:MAG: hypothetical protein ABF289_05925 [Clostridiales bacterium]
MEKKGIVIDLKLIYAVVLTLEQKRYRVFRRKNMQIGNDIIFSEKNELTNKKIIIFSTFILVCLSFSFFVYLTVLDNNDDTRTAIKYPKTSPISLKPTTTTTTSERINTETIKTTILTPKLEKDKTTTPHIEESSTDKSSTNKSSTDETNDSLISPSNNILDKTSITPETVIDWSKKSNVAEYGERSWNNEIKRVKNISLEEAKKIGEENSDITYFFYVKSRLVLADKGVFNSGDAVFFSGSPWYGDAVQADSYEKNITSE